MGKNAYLSSIFGEPVTVFSPSVESTLPPSILHPPWGAKTIARSGHYHFHLPHQWVVKTTILKQMIEKSESAKRIAQHVGVVGGIKTRPVA